MKKRITFIILLVLSIHFCFADIDWKNNSEEKIQGLVTVWSEVKFGFPYPDKLEDLGWENKFKEYLPRVIAAGDVDSYYNILMELSTLLNDSHTAVMPPWEYFKPGHDMPPVEVRVINDRFYIVELERTEDILENGIEIGTEILEIEGIPVRQYFQKNILKYYTQGSPHASDVFYVIYLLFGPADETIDLKIRDIKGDIREVALKRNSWEGKGPLIYEFAYNSLIADKIEYRFLKKNILYVKIPTFEKPGIAESFLEMIDSTNLSKVKGMIIDLRNNIGGSSKYCNSIVGSLIDEPVSSPYQHVRYYSAAHKAWGRKQLTDHKNNMIKPRDGKRYTGSIIVLINALTSSSGEDMAIELKAAKRAKIIGQYSTGGAGNTLIFELPGGGYLRMATFKATFPDGTEYIGTGIKPDVEISPSIEDLIKSNDPVLNKALKMLK